MLNELKILGYYTSYQVINKGVGPQKNSATHPRLYVDIERSRIGYRECVGYRLHQVRSLRCVPVIGRLLYSVYGVWHVVSRIVAVYVSRVRLESVT